MTWDSTPEMVYDESPSRTLGTYIRVNGSDVAVEPGTDFVTTVKENARAANLGKFRLYLDGTEISPAEAPSVFEEGMKAEMRPYDVAG